MDDPGRQPRGLGWLAFFLLKLFVLGFLKLYCRFRIENRPERDGPFVVVANHTSFLDPLIVGAAVAGWGGARRVIFMMSSVMARSRLLGWFYRANKVIAVSPQGRNRAALRAAREVLSAGQILCVFPEGGISRDGRLLLGSPGAVALGLVRKAPVVPVGITGANGVFPYGAVLPRPRRITVRFGDAIPVEELFGSRERKDGLLHATARIMHELARLTDQVSREEELGRLAVDPEPVGSTQPTEPS